MTWKSIRKKFNFLNDQENWQNFPTLTKKRGNDRQLDSEKV